MATVSRRRVVAGLGLATLAVAGGGTAGLAALGSTRRPRLLHDLKLSPGPDAGVRDNHVPASQVATTRVELDSKAMGRKVGWTLSMPATVARAVVFCLHGKGGDHHFAFDTMHLPDIVAAQHASLAIAAVDGGDDSYWHRRADGTDAQAMLLDESYR